MMLTSRRFLLCTSFALATPGLAFAQTWQERVYISVNGAFQATKNNFRDRFDFERYLESGFTEVDYPVEGGFIFDAGGGYRLFKNLGVGVAVSSFSRDAAAPTRSSVPHPFFFNQSREVTGDATSLARSELAVHIQAQYLWDPSGPLRFVFSGGPSYFTVEQDIVTAVQVDEAFPYDTASFGSASVRGEKSTVPAFNVGVDVMWMLGETFGVGGLVRFSPASVDVSAPGNRTISVDAGGVYAGGGVRIVF